MTIGWAGERLELLPERALLWATGATEATLVLADPHFGKTAAFRAGGIPVPPGTTAADLARLDALLRAHAPRRLVILGDFLHARAGRAPDTLAQLAAWRDRHEDLPIELVAGNHDRSAGAPPEEWRIRVHDRPLRDGPFLYCHEPPARPPAGCHVLAGHVHPVFSLEDRTAHLRAPGFLFGARHALLPAFGGFTGGRSIRPAAGERIYVVGEGEVVAIPA